MEKRSKGECMLRAALAARYRTGERFKEADIWGRERREANRNGQPKRAVKHQRVQKAGLIGVAHRGQLTESHGAPRPPAAAPLVDARWEGRVRHRACTLRGY